jgi:membrane dipeptidase
VTLDHVVAHIDHICQTIGDAAHAGIGSDLDGGFGAADIPAPLDSIADLPQIATALAAKGYSETDIAGIMGGNWVNLLRRTWGG